MIRLRSLLVLLWATAAALVSAAGPSVPEGFFGELRWRCLGPFRGGRTKAAAGIPSQPNVFFIGAVNGGVWKSTDYGRTWRPIFDDQPTGSIGAIAIAPSDPNVIYVGSGEGLQRPDLSTGDGIYKSLDGGATWQHLGLRDGQQIPQIAVDPRDARRLFVAVLGHPYGPNEERGLFRSTDGGATFWKVLYTDPDTGAVDVVIDPRDPHVVYAAMWESRQAPWENGEFSGPGSGLYKSVDGGDTWKQLTRGLPSFAEGLGRIGITVAPSSPRRLFATVEAGERSGIYRSDDSGESWNRICADPRVAERPDDFAEVKVDPTNPDVVYSASVVLWKSSDGGSTWTALRGAPGGDDYHRIWINPINPKILLVASDQGAVVTVNGGETWSSWYNQPTAQFYHVSTDNAFPYRVCGGQQESGSACVSSRGDDGQITFREWHPVGVDEYGYAAPDPLDPDIVYGGRVTRYDRKTGQVQNVGPRPIRGDGYRVLRTAPVVFSPVDLHVLYFASNVLWKTTNGGESWDAISSDLARKEWTVPGNASKYAKSDEARPTQRGVIYAVAPSPLDAGVLWAGTDDGLIHLTRDGGVSWHEVTPPQLRPWDKVSILEASHFDASTAYAAINAFRLDDLRPHIYRTRDWGRTWTESVAGIPEGGAVNVVREDPVRRGLLYAGTERQVYVSFDDGESWQSLRLNMPATSIRDLVVKDADLLAATHGRGFWILDDISPLREVAAGGFPAAAALFRPRGAWRVRWNLNTDTPLPPDEPAAQNPPDGATLHYFIDATPPQPVTLDILDPQGRLVRRYASDDPVEQPVEGRNIPDYWIRPPVRLLATPGLHRFVWDLRYAPPAVEEFDYPMTAVASGTPREPRGPLVQPGTYVVRLKSGGRTIEQPLNVRMDPRVKTSTEALGRRFQTLMRVYDALRQLRETLVEIRRVRARLKEQIHAAGPARPGQDPSVLDRETAEIEGEQGGGTAPANLTQLLRQFARLYDLIEDSDCEPAGGLRQAVEERSQALRDILRRWDEVKTGLAE